MRPSTRSIPGSLAIGMAVQVVFPPAVDDGDGPIVLPRWVAIAPV